VVFTAISRMPKVRRETLPRVLFRHLVDRALERSISTDQLELLFDWLESRKCREKNGSSGSPR